MGISIAVVANLERVVASIDDPGNILHRVLPLHDAPDFHCLNKIDLYGDTVFNRLQVPALMDELRRLCEGINDMQALTLLNKILAMAKQVQSEPHHYLRFYGD